MGTMHPKQTTYKLNLTKFLETMNPKRIRLILIRFAAVFLDSHRRAPMFTWAVPQPQPLPHHVCLF